MYGKRGMACWSLLARPAATRGAARQLVIETGRLERGSCCERITTSAWEIDGCPRGRLGPYVRAILTCRLPPHQVRPASAAVPGVRYCRGCGRSSELLPRTYGGPDAAVRCRVVRERNGTGGGSIDARTYLGRHRLIITGMGSCRRRRRFLRRLPPEICFTEGGLK